MIDINSLTKLYYSIGEVADMFSVSKSLVRYWETEFDFLTPKKNKKGDRRFTKENIQQLQIVYDLVKVRGFTLDGAKHEIRKNKKALNNRQEVIKRLHNIKRKLGGLIDELEE